MSKKRKKREIWREGIYLTTVENSLEAEILESKLLSEGIPVLKKYKGASNFIEIVLGTNITFPIELYVPEEKLKDAKNIIIPVPIDDDFDENFYSYKNIREEEE